MWKLPDPRPIRMEESLPRDRFLPAERALAERWRREDPARYRRLVEAGTLMQAARHALNLRDRMELEIRAQNPRMTPMEADQHVRHVLSLAPRDPS